MSTDPRWLAYTRGELSLEEARAFEAELERAGSKENEMPAHDRDVETVRAAMKALDAVEAERTRAPGRRVWNAPGRLILGFGLLAAAAIAALVYFAWPSDDPEPRIAEPDRTPPRLVIPADTMVAAPEVAVATDASALAVVDVGPEPPPERVVDNRLIGAKDGRALAIDLASSALGRGAAWRRDQANAGRSAHVVYVGVTANPQMQAMATSGFLHEVVRCIDDSHTTAAKLVTSLWPDSGKSPARVDASSGDSVLDRCVESFEVGAWPTRAVTFVFTLSEHAPLNAPMPGKQKIAPGK